MVNFTIISAAWTADLNTDLDSYWTLDEASGTTAYDSLGAVNMTNNGMVVNQGGANKVLGTAYDNDQGTDYLNYGNFHAHTDPFSYAQWIKPDGLGGRLFNNDVSNTAPRGFTFETAADGRIGIYTGIGSSYSATGTLTNNVWNFVVLTYNGTTVHVYVDAFVKVDAELSFNDVTKVAYIGVRNGGAGPYAGWMDEIGLWSRELTSDEVTLLYNSGTGITYDSDPAPADTCTYSGSGTWEVNCADNCSITSQVDLGGEDITITGFGTFTTDSDIINYGDLLIEGVDSTHRCEVMCNGGCFKT